MKGYNYDEAKRYFNDKLNFTISCSRLKAKLDNKDTDYQILDVRHKDAYNEGRIPGAIFIDADNLDDYWDSFSEDKLNIIYCYGMLCHRGYQVCLKALDKGYAVADLLGNYDGWFNYPFDIEK